MGSAGPGGAASRAGPAAGPPTEAELRAVAARYIAGCAADPGGWTRLLAAVAENPGAGFTGAILIAAQEPGPAAGYDAWKAAGWQVRKGERARLWVLDDGRPAAVFTRAQVRPARQGTSPPPPGTVTASAGTPERAFGALIAVARRHGYAVHRPAEPGRPCTDFDQHSITIPASLDPPAATAALARELAYVIGAGDRPRLAGETTAARTGAAVIEAGSAAWLVLTRLGLDPSAAGLAFPAARAWAGGDPRSPLAGLVTAAGERITEAAAQITEHAAKVLASLPPAPDPPAARPTAAAVSYGRYPRARPPGTARVTALPDWPVPDQALIQVNMAAAAFYRARLDGSWAAEYLDSRGFGPDICRRWQLGYAPRSWTSLCDHLRAAGFTDQVIEQAGLATISSRGSLIDCFRDRVIIPIRGPHGQVVAFAGRARDGDPDKYINTRKTPIYSKNEVLYGLPEAAAALSAGARPALVEGYFDVIATTIAGAGKLAGVAPCGTSLSTVQVRLLSGACDLARTPLLDARDADAAGRRAALRDYQILAPYCPAATTPVLPERSDPAAIYAQDGREALVAALAAGERPLADVAVDAVVDPWEDKLRWAEGQLGAVRAAARLIADVPPADVTRQIRRLAERTGLPPEVVNDEFIAAVSAERRPKAPGRDPGRPGLARREFPAPPAPRRAAPGRGRPARAGRPSGRRPPHR